MKVNNKRTMREALREVRDRLTYFCARLDGKYAPPWVTELVGIIDEALAATPEPIGNAVKLRKALAAYLALWDNGTMNYLDELKRVIKQMREAIAEPPRNCDRFDGDINLLRDACLRERGLNPEEDFTKVFCEWLLEPAKEEGMVKILKVLRRDK